VREGLLDGSPTCAESPDASKPLSFACFSMSRARSRSTEEPHQGLSVPCREGVKRSVVRERAVSRENAQVVCRLHLAPHVLHVLAECLRAGHVQRVPMLADGRIYVTNEDGLTSVYKAGPVFELPGGEPVQLAPVRGVLLTSIRAKPSVVLSEHHGVFGRLTHCEQRRLDHPAKSEAAGVGADTRRGTPLASDGPSIARPDRARAGGPEGDVPSMVVSLGSSGSEQRQRRNGEGGLPALPLFAIAYCGGLSQLLMWICKLPSVIVMGSTVAELPS